VADRSSFYFAVLAARSPRQTVVDEQVELTPEVPFQRVPFGPTGHELIRVSVDPGPFTLTYDA
jgi:hypothetical protein